jgi:hypothetical protein
MPDGRIIGLDEWGLGVVPGYRIDPKTGQEDVRWRKKFFQWYEKTREWRAWGQEEFLKGEEFFEKALLKGSRECAFFTTLFMEIEEPRSMEYFDPSGFSLEDALAGLKNPEFAIGTDEDIGYKTIHPYIPFAYQIEAWRLLTYIVLGPLRGFHHDLLWEKARGIGMSYAFLAWAYWAWLHVAGLRGVLLTEKWDKAERSNDLNSLFGKLDLFINATPDVILPAGFKDRGEKGAHRQKGSLLNPVTEAALFTEPTTADATRGGRDAYVAFDEMAFQEYLDETWATAGGTTKHRIGWSSTSYRYGRQAERKIRQGQKAPQRVTVQILDWFENPHQDESWKTSERERFRAAGQEEQFEVEYLRNAAAGTGRLVYKQQVDLAPFTDGWYDPRKPLKCSVDVGTEDFTAAVFWQTHFPEGKKRIRWLDAFQVDKLPVDYWAHLLTGIAPRGEHKDENGLAQPADPAWPLWLEGFYEGYAGHIMAWMAKVNPAELWFYGDPSMNAKDSTHQTWAKNLSKKTVQLRIREFGKDSPKVRPVEVRIPWDAITKRNNFADRRVGMREALTISEFSKNEGCLELREALENSMFQKITEMSTRPPGHVHDLHSHLVSAAEFGMTWEMINLTPQDVSAPRLAKIEQPKTTKRTRPAPSSGYQRAKRANQRWGPAETLVGVS